MAREKEDAMNKVSELDFLLQSEQEKSRGLRKELESRELHNQSPFKQGAMSLGEELDLPNKQILMMADQSPRHCFRSPMPSTPFSLQRSMSSLESLGNPLAFSSELHDVQERLQEKIEEYQVMQEYYEEEMGKLRELCFLLARQRNDALAEQEHLECKIILAMASTLSLSMDSHSLSQKVVRKQNNGFLRGFLVTFLAIAFSLFAMVVGLFRPASPVSLGPM
tara:strand:- start:268 stop:933 length:666 start_codon:yes stop_codon:yes gene_type:complete